MTTDRIWTYDEWKAEGNRLFGPTLLDWRFVCPVCGHVATARDWKAAGAPEGAIGFSCVGRYLDKCPALSTREGPGPCDYSGGGLIGLNPLALRFTPDSEPHRFFAFAEPTAQEPTE